VSHRITEIKEFLADARVGPALFAEVTGHFKQAMKRNSGFDEHAILRRLPIRVRDRLMLYHYQELLDTVPFFRYIQNPSVKLYLLKNMRNFSVDTDRFLVREGDFADSIVFVWKGTAELKRTVLTAQERKMRDRAQYGHLGSAFLWCLQAHKALEIEEQEEREEQERRDALLLQQQLQESVMRMLEDPHDDDVSPVRNVMQRMGNAFGFGTLSRQHSSMRGHREPGVGSEMEGSVHGPRPGLSDSLHGPSLHGGSLHGGSLHGAPPPAFGAVRLGRKASFREPSFRDVSGPLSMGTNSRRGSRQVFAAPPEEVPGTGVGAGAGAGAAGQSSETDGATLVPPPSSNFPFATAAAAAAATAAPTAPAPSTVTAPTAEPPAAAPTIVAPVSIAGPPPTGLSSIRLSPFGHNFPFSRRSFGLIRADSSDTGTPPGISPSGSGLGSQPYSRQSSLTASERKKGDDRPSSGSGSSIKSKDGVRVGKFRVSARAKIRWEKIRLYLGTIVQMGFERRKKAYDVLGTLGPGDFFGHTEVRGDVGLACMLSMHNIIIAPPSPRVFGVCGAQCAAKEKFPCSLVSAEPCSFCVLSVAVLLRITQDYPAMAMELQVPEPFFLSRMRCFSSRSHISVSTPRVYGVALRQAALGRCVADMNKKEEYRRWRKKNVDFMDKVCVCVCMRCGRVVVVIFPRDPSRCLHVSVRRFLVCRGAGGAPRSVAATFSNPRGGGRGRGRGRGAQGVAARGAVVGA
jgi:hypothetical protein